jgi:hypothetical protein
MCGAVYGSFTLVRQELSGREDVTASIPDQTLRPQSFTLFHWLARRNA